MAMDGARLRELFLDFARCAKVLDGPSDERTLAKLIEVLKYFLRERGLNLIENAGSHAILVSYGSDATPMLTRACFSQQGSDGRRVTRNAFRAEEFLVERMFIKVVDAGGRPSLVCVQRDPRPLSDGKTSFHHLAAMTQLFPFVPCLLGSNIVVSHYAFDRAQFSALGRLVRQRHSLFHAKQLDAAGDDGEQIAEAHLAALRDWTVVTACSMHDTHNALKWALSGICEAEVTRTLWSVVSALRHAFDLLMGCLASFVVENLVWVDEQLGSQDELYSFWTVLGLPSDLADDMAQLGIFWRNGRLQVHRSHIDEEDVIGRITFIYLSVSRFRAWSNSRWVSMGDTCRSLIALQCLGLEAWVMKVRVDPSKSDYHLHAAGQLDKECLLYATLCSLVSPVCDSVLVSLFEDDRVARRFEVIEQTIAEECQFVQNIPMTTWSFLSEATGAAPPMVLRSHAMFAVSAAAGFMDMRFLRVARGYPWSLARGDFDENLKTLLRDDAVVDPVAQKIKKLAAFGYPSSAIKEGLDRLSDCHWTTMVHEQAHASGARMHQCHVMYGTRTLIARAGLHMARAMFHEEKGDSVLAKLDLRADKLVKRQPEKISGRQLFFADLVKTAKGPDQSVLPKETMNLLMSRHTMLFDRISEERKRAYVIEAQRLVAEARDEIFGDLAHLDSARELQRRRTNLERLEEAQKCRLANCRLDTHDLTRMAELWQSGKYTDSCIAGLREVAMEPPLPPTESTRERLSAQSDSEASAGSALPVWCIEVCRRRSHLKQSAILWFQDGHEHVVALLFALLQPYTACFVPLTRVQELDNVPLPSKRDHDGFARENYDHIFAVDWSKRIFGQDIQVPEGTDMFVLQELVTVGNSVCSNGNLIEWLDFLESLPMAPAERAKQAKAGAEGAKCARPASSEGFAWLDRYVNDEVGGSGDPRSSCEQRAHAVSPLDDEQIEQVFQELESKRQEWCQEYNTDDLTFKTRIFGGKWTQEHLHVVADAAGGFASTADGREFCRLYGVQNSMRFNFQRYSEPVAVALALHWSRRMEYYYNLWYSQPCADYVFTEADHAAAPFTEKLADAASDLPIDHPVWDALQKVDASKPGKVVLGSASIRRSSAASSSGAV